MSQKYEKLKTLLKELFQLDQPDLDFGLYRIPYEDEEVKLHWANRDQYYNKTSEYLRDYAFRLRPDDDQKPMRVHIRLTDATEGEHGNVQAAEGKDRVFILTAGDFIAEE